MKPQGRVGDLAFASSDGHGCPACAHPVIGPGIAGSSDVLVNWLPALRDKDPGIHAACCGPNQWKADGGAPHVFINGERAFRRDDPTRHCGGNGKLIVGSPNVLVGDQGGGSAEVKSFIQVRVLDKAGRPVEGVRYNLTLPDGRSQTGKVDRFGWIFAFGIPEGQCTLKLERPTP